MTRGTPFNQHWVQPMQRTGSCSCRWLTPQRWRRSRRRGSQSPRPSWTQLDCTPCCSRRRRTRCSGSYLPRRRRRPPTRPLGTARSWRSGTPRCVPSRSSSPKPHLSSSCHTGCCATRESTATARLPMRPRSSACSMRPMCQPQPRLRMRQPTVNKLPSSSKLLPAIHQPQRARCSLNWSRRSPTRSVPRMHWQQHQHCALSAKSPSKVFRRSCSALRRRLQRCATRQLQPMRARSSSRRHWSSQPPTQPPRCVTAPQRTTRTWHLCAPS